MTDGPVDSEEEYPYPYHVGVTLLKIRKNHCCTTELHGSGDDRLIQNMTDESWDELGRDISISNNHHLMLVELNSRALNDNKCTGILIWLYRYQCAERKLPRSSWQ